MDLNIYSKFKKTKEEGWLKLLPLGDVRGNKHALMNIQQRNPQHLYAVLYAKNCIKIKLMKLRNGYNVMVVSNGCITIALE